jgi:hypothetical protein
VFADIAKGTLINLALVVKVQVSKRGASGMAFKFHSPTDRTVAEYCPATLEDMKRRPGHLRAFRPGNAASWRRLADSYLFCKRCRT